MIGITEAGDPTFDRSWVAQLSKMEGAIIITKSSPMTMENDLMQYKDKIILHQTITGFGNTLMEKGVPSPSFVLDGLTTLIQHGFPVEHVVLRIDPIFPSLWYGTIGVQRTQFLFDLYQYAMKMGIKRVRYSYIDPYHHVVDRLRSFYPDYPMDMLRMKFTTDDMESIQYSLMTFESSGITLESCAETNTPEHHKTGCVSIRDLMLLHLPVTQDAYLRKGQRATCLCCKCKQELLKQHKCPCPHGCLYCYWKGNIV